VPCKCLSINTCCSFWVRGGGMYGHAAACVGKVLACRGMQEHVEHLLDVAWCSMQSLCIAHIRNCV
jgi:hypothetical protein